MWRSLKLLVFVVCVSIKSFSQDCKTLDRFNSFHGIKFGERLPDSLRKYCSYHYYDGNADTTFYIREDKIKGNKKLLKWANFGATFSVIGFSVIEDGRLYRAFLSQNFTEEDSIALANYKNPFFLQAVTKELNSFFGTATKTSKTEDEFSKEIIRTWECDKMKVEFTFAYSGIKSYYLVITDKELDKVRQGLKYVR